MDDVEVGEAIGRLALKIRDVVRDGLASGTLKPEEHLYFRRHVLELDTETGPRNWRTSGEDIRKPVWYTASIEVEKSVRDSEEYSNALKVLSNVYPERDSSDHLQYFLSRVAWKALEDGMLSETDIEKSVLIFLKDVHNDPVKCGAEVELLGVALEPQQIEISHGITLRRTNIRDVEKEYPVFPFGYYSVTNPLLELIPSAILSITFLGRTPREIQNRVEQAVAILRLFKVGSVKWETYRMHSESFLDTAGGTLSSRKRGAALETYLVAIDDALRLKKFWQAMVDAVPRQIYDPVTSKADHSSIAFQRYTDALMENGLIERRIANAIMGLEALYLKPRGEMQELQYRLGLRASKLLGMFVSDRVAASEQIKDAYTVRSIYVHGGQLSYKDRKKLQAKYGDVKNLLLAILEYLRISIIAMLHIRHEKDEFLDLIDDSFVEKAKNEDLDRTLAPVVEIIR